MSALSRRFYVALAKEYNEAKPSVEENTTAYQAWLHMVLKTAGVIQISAGTFDKTRFLAACGVEDKVVAALG